MDQPGPGTRGPEGSDTLLAFSGLASPWKELQKLGAEGGGEGDQFGGSVAIDGDLLLVGAEVDGPASQGAVHVFERIGESWIQSATLMASDGVGGDSFGFAVALEADTALIGARFADPGGSPLQGAVYVFVLEDGIWHQQAKLVAGDGGQFDQFGHSVALSGNLALVGAVSADVGDEINQGLAYVFLRSGTSWSEQARLAATDGMSGDLSGTAVAMVGNTALVGAPEAMVGDAFFQGAVYAFTSSGGSWTEQQKLTSSGSNTGQKFGSTLSMDGDRVLIGAPEDGLAENFLRGAAYVFSRSDDAWFEGAKLASQEDSSLDMFGSSVNISGDTVLVGAPSFDVGPNEFQGAAHVFVLDGGQWIERAQLTAADGRQFDRFGTSVALEDGKAVIGALAALVDGNVDQGAAYVFAMNGSTGPPPGGPNLEAISVPVNSRIGLFLLALGIIALTFARTCRRPEC